MNKVIAICGMAGAGKSEARKFFETKGYEYIHLGVTEETIRRYGKTTEELEKKVRKEMRETQGQGVMAKIALPKINAFLEEKKDVVIDNMYSWDEYKIFKNEYKENFIPIAIHASPKIRYNRLINRKDIRHTHGYKFDEKICQERDYSEIEVADKGGPIAMADHHYVNEGSQEDLIKKMDEIYNKTI